MEGRNVRFDAAVLLRGGGKSAVKAVKKPSVKKDKKDTKQKKVVKQVETESESNEEDDEDEEDASDDSNVQPTPVGRKADIVSDAVKTYEDNLTIAKASPAFNSTFNMMFEQIGNLVTMLKTDPENTFNHMLKDKSSVQLEVVQMSLADVGRGNGNPASTAPHLFRACYELEANMLDKMSELERAVRKTFSKVLNTTFITTYGSIRSKGINKCDRTLKKLIREKMKQEAEEAAKAAAKAAAAEAAALTSRGRRWM